jgi:hypothetical protein
MILGSRGPSATMFSRTAFTLRRHGGYSEARVTKDTQIGCRLKGSSRAVVSNVPARESAYEGVVSGAHHRSRERS